VRIGEGREMSIVILRNTVIPTKMERNYTTRYDNQTFVLFAVYEDERARAVDNNWLEKFVLSLILEAFRSVAQMKVCFEIDANGILIVSTMEQSTCLSYKITITN
jgi:heat shock protein 1/8